MNPETSDSTHGGLAAGEPDPDFVRNLEWQVRTAARREGRFARPAASGTLRIMKVAAIAAVALIGGASGTLAVQHLQQSRTTAILGHRAGIELALAQRRVALIASRAAQLQQQHQAGRISVTDVERATAELARARTDEMLRRSELDEVAASGRAADDSLAAPRAGGRDFTGERLVLRRDDAGAAVAAARVAVERISALSQRGFAPETDLAAARVEVARREAEASAFAVRLELRRRFLAGEIGAARVELEGRRADVTARSQALAAEAAGGERALKHVQALQRMGSAPQTEVDSATLSLAEAQSSLELLRDELALIDEEIATIK